MTNHATLSQAARQARNLTHPQLCLDAIQYGVEHGGYAGLEKVCMPFLTAACFGYRCEQQAEQPPEQSASTPTAVCHHTLGNWWHEGQTLPMESSRACADPCIFGLQEQECFAKAASLDTHKALVHIFFAQRSTKKVRCACRCRSALHCALSPSTIDFKFVGRTDTKRKLSVSLFNAAIEAQRFLHSLLQVTPLMNAGLLCAATCVAAFRHALSVDQ